MNEKKSAPSGLIIIGGFLLGLIAGPTLMLLSLQKTGFDNSSPGAGIGIVGVFLYLVIGAVVSAAVVGSIAGWLSTMPHTRPGGLVLAILGFAALPVIAIKIRTYFMGDSGYIKTVSIPAQKNQYPTPQPVPYSSPNYHATPAPVITPPPVAVPTPSSAPSAVSNDSQLSNPTPEEMTAAYGDLFYANAKILPTHQVMPRPDVPCAFQVTQSDDSFDVVVTYYKSRFPPERESDTRYLIKTNRASDGKLTFIDVQNKGGTVYITYSAG